LAPYIAAAVRSNFLLIVLNHKPAADFGAEMAERKSLRLDMSQNR